MATVVVIGGSGFIGSHLCARLGARGWRIVVPTRRADRARHLLTIPTIEVVEADVHADAALDALLAGADAVVNLVGVLHSPSGAPYGPAFARAHVELPRRLALACARNGVSRLVHVSALGADEHGPSEYQRSKAAGEVAIRENAGPVGWTILRPSVVFGPGDRFLNMFVTLCQLFPVLPLGGAHARFQPVFVGDLVGVIERSLDDPSARQQTFEVAGPRAYTLAELVRYAGRLVGRRPCIVPLPNSLAMLQAAVLECLPNPPMSRDNVRSMQRDNVASGAPPPFGMRATAMEAVVPGYLQGRLGRRGFHTFWRRARRGDSVN